MIAARTWRWWRLVCRTYTHSATVMRGGSQSLWCFQFHSCFLSFFWLGGGMSFPTILFITSMTLQCNGWSLSAITLPSVVCHQKEETSSCWRIKVYKEVYRVPKFPCKLSGWKQRVLKDLRWCIRHHSSVEKSVGLNKSGYGARFDSGRQPVNSN